MENRKVVNECGWAQLKTSSLGHRWEGRIFFRNFVFVAPQYVLREILISLVVYHQFYLYRVGEGG